MIQNEKELNVIECWIVIFKKAIKDKEDMRPFWETTNDYAILGQAELDGMKSKLKELEQDAADYKKNL